MKAIARRFALLLVLIVPSVTLAQSDAGYDQMVKLFDELRVWRQPLLSKKPMDYSAPALAARKAQLATLRSRLDAISPAAWPREHHVEYLLVRSQFDDLEFEQRVLRPWSRDPGLYVDFVRDIPYTPLPLKQEEVAAFRARLDEVPSLLQQGKENLTEGAGELARLALRNLEKHDGVGHEQGFREVPPEGVLGWYADLLNQVSKHHPELLPSARKAQAAVRDFHAWLKTSLPKMTGPAGVGRKDYDWYLQRVVFAPYDGAQIIIVGERELARTSAALKLEQYRNRDLPLLLPAATSEEYDRRIAEADRWVRKFIAERQYLTIPAVADKAFDNNVPWIVRPGGRRNFWEEVQYRDPLPDKVHAGIPGHRFDLFLHDLDTRPVRRHITDGARIEGWAFYLEEGMMLAGLLEHRPRTRELFWIFAMARAVRNKAEVMMHANQWTVEQAVRYMVDNVPYMDEDVARVDCEIYLRNPTYGQNYQMGKVEIEALLTAYAAQKGDAFDLGEFHDRFLASGTIPISLIRWEMTGDASALRPHLVWAGVAPTNKP